MAKVNPSLPIRFWNTFNVTLPNINANTTGELAILPATFNAGAYGSLSPESMVIVSVGDPNAGAVAFPAALGVSHGYVKAADGKLYVRFANETVGNYTSADIVTLRVMAW